MDGEKGKGKREKGKGKREKGKGKQAHSSQPTVGSGTQRTEH
jgi:hypothetical protein